MSVTVTHNADKVFKQLEAYRKQLNSKYSKALERVAVIGGGTARVKFTQALYAGDNDVEIEVKRVSNTCYQVIASGKTVLFIEFGTGVNNPEYTAPSGLTYQHGTYGKGHGADPNGWVYVGKQGNNGKYLADGVYHTTGNPPAKAMYQASKDMQEEITRVFREEFQSK